MSIFKETRSTEPQRTQFSVLRIEPSIDVEKTLKKPFKKNMKTDSQFWLALSLCS
jgi:hypothetical protein